MKKRFLASALLVAVVASMTACGPKIKVSTNAAQEEAEDAVGELEAALQELQTALDEATASTSTEDVEPEEEEVEETETEEVEDEAPATVAGGELSQIVVDNDVYTFEITGVEVEEGDWGTYAWKATVTNKSDATIRVSMDEVSINGVMCDPYFYSNDITAGKSSNETIDWYLEDLAARGIDAITQVEFSIHATDVDSYDELTEYEWFTVYPMGQDAAVIQTREAQPNDQVLVDNDQFTMIITGYEEDTDWEEFKLNVYLVNKTDKNLYFDVDNASINNVMCDPYWGEYVPAGKASYAYMDWSSYNLEESNLTLDDIGTIELPIVVRDYDSYDDLFSETYIFTK